MILPDKRPVQSDFANLTDYSLECPKGTRKFFAFIHFTDDSTCLWSNIFTFNRTYALMLAIEKFGACLEYVSSINIHEQDYLKTLASSPQSSDEQSGLLPYCLFNIQRCYHSFFAFIFSDPPGWWRPSAILTSLRPPFDAYILPSPSIIGRGSASLHFD